MAGDSFNHSHKTGDFVGVPRGERVNSAAEVTTWQTKVAVSCSIFGETAGEGLPTL